MISRLRNFKSRLFDSLDRRFRRSRPGSVLILVVALLVLLALLGTAYINTAQSDRFSSVQNSFNTEVEMLLQGLEQVTQGTVANSLFVKTGNGTPSVFHGTDSTNNPVPYAMTDYPLNNADCFIADRYPTVPNLSLPATQGNTNFPIWNFLTVMPTLARDYESPYVAPTATPPSPQVYVAAAAPSVMLQGLLPSKLSPYFITIPQGTTTQTFPVLTDGTNLYLAADTDGDGIADAVLFPLPIGQSNGIKWFGAVRIVDNAAAINAAIAIAPNPTGSTLPGDFFPTNLDLNGLLVTGDQGTNYSNFNKNARFNGQTSPTVTPYDDYGNLRNDFTFGSPYEAFWMQVGRRLGNPGYFGTGSSSQYTALPTSEMQTMARHFILRDPSVTSATASSSSLEQNLQYSTYNNQNANPALAIPTTPYAPAGTSAAAIATTLYNWYTTNFDFVNNSGNVSLRSMLVTQNGVSNFTYSRLHSTGSTSTTSGAFNAGQKYNFGDWVTYTSASYTDPISGQPTTMTRAYVCMQQNTGQTPVMNTATVNGKPVPQPASSPYWEPEPWTSGPTKTSANTATFGQLWAAYYSAMTETPLTATSLGSVTNAASTAMFRRSLRTVAPSGWPQNTVGNTAGFPQMQLRAAIAAINTLQLRNPNSGSAATAPLSATINLTDINGNPAYQAVVYGSAPQPYITEVYGSTIGGTPAVPGYIAIELCNPYPFAIPLTGWQLAYIPRATGSASLTPTAIAWGSTGAPTVPAATSPSSYGYLTLISATTAPDPTITAQPTGMTSLVPNLVNALNNEIVLLRPSAAAPAAGSWATTATLTATAPVDSYDFTGLIPNDPAANNGEDWHYIRPNDPTLGKAWHFVYPGPIATPNGGSGTETNPRETGTKANAGPTAQITTLATFGAADGKSATDPPTNNITSYIDRPLQINNTAFGGPNKATTATGNTFPYGGFARNADLLQVTYIGAYQITDPTGAMLYELNALPADSAMADDPNLSKDANAVTSEQLGRQNIGRFTPVHWADTLVAATMPPYSSLFASEYAAYQATQAAGMTPATYPYAPDDYYYSSPATMVTGYQWARRLFDYVTVQSPQDDYLPDVDPGTSVAPGTAPVYPGATPAGLANVNKTVANASVANSPASATEETAPVHGRININTANWRMLATLPLFDNPSNQAAANDMAKAIVYYRDVDDGSTGGSPLHPHGAFQSIDELNNVPVSGTTNPVAPTVLVTAGTTFRNAFGGYYSGAPTTPTPTIPMLFPVAGLHGSNIDGDLSPNAATAAADMVYGDFENQNLALNRISNLITTRSDSFTAYVLVQGWRNAGTNAPQLVVQRRGAFIIDRSTITPANNTQPAVTNVPTE